MSHLLDYAIIKLLLGGAYVEALYNGQLIIV